MGTRLDALGRLTRSVFFGATGDLAHKKVFDYWHHRGRRDADAAP
jgi:glucose-6-phosphate 1-dehydrogenase